MIKCASPGLTSVCKAGHLAVDTTQEVHVLIILIYMDTALTTEVTEAAAQLHAV